MVAMYAVHTSYEYDFGPPRDSFAEQLTQRKKALEKEFLAIEQTAVAKLKKPNWDEPGLMRLEPS